MRERTLRTSELELCVRRIYMEGRGKSDGEIADSHGSLRVHPPIYMYPRDNPLAEAKQSMWRETRGSLSTKAEFQYLFHAIFRCFPILSFPPSLRLHFFFSVIIKSSCDSFFCFRSDVSRYQEGHYFSTFLFESL